MNGQAQTGNDLQQAGACDAARDLVFGRAHRPDARFAGAPDSAGSHDGLREAGEPGPDGIAPHFIGALLIASSVGFIGCVAALIIETSVWQSLAVYALTGLLVFLFLMITRTGPQTDD
ncbi:MAG: hypothetical protein RLZZ413_3157 [Pseudomonadota bacterium]|jgi:uncharacterized membrane protein